ncbi:UdgX family uracil-DNA binding protein [Streptomyces sp. NPDC004647]|uniref:UdgX family uracil-DNA binding protein n=1 Tax=Streptomyces sp. NPDC004647 TaxID=3154671 RepID=UPI0033BA117E
MADGRSERPGKPGKAAYDSAPYVPEGSDLQALRQAAAGCRGCPLFENATQTVFGAGNPEPRLVLVGEQPGDQEDQRGEPFVGPAGRLLSRALDDAGLDMRDAYVTNAVKHFKFVRDERGKRRIHKPPTLREVAACRPWLEAELDVLAPEIVVTLGATAGKSLMGSSFHVTQERGVLRPMNGAAGTDSRPQLVATIHPSAVLRARDRDSVYGGLVSDLTVVAQALG